MSEVQILSPTVSSAEIHTHTPLPRVFPIASGGPAGQEVIEQVAVGQPNLCEGQDTAFSVVLLEQDVSLELVHLARRLS